MNNLGTGESEQDIRKLFEPFGPLHSVSISVPRPGAKSTVCWVTYEDHSSAAAALEAMKSKQSKSTAGRLHVERARPKGEREKELKTFKCIWFEGYDTCSTDAVSLSNLLRFLIKLESEKH